MFIDPEYTFVGNIARATFPFFSMIIPIDKNMSSKFVSETLYENDIR